jgi:hypothetical protein
MSAPKKAILTRCLEKPAATTTSAMGNPLLKKAILHTA